jgi:Cu+-exporting ATPase
VYWGVQAGPTQGISVALAVLLVSCPCALGLGGPLAAMVALRRAGTHGFILRSADVFERLASVSVTCWDKTGTITSGRPRVRDVHCANGVSQPRLIALAGSLSRYSRHPFAQAIVACASGLPAHPVCQSDWVIGRGASGKVMEGHIMTDVLIGNVSWMQERGLSRHDLELCEQTQLPGSDSVYCAIDRKLAGAFVIEDPGRQGVAEAVASLRTLGIRSMLLTGDREMRAKETARAVGIPEAFGQLLPQDKINVIRGLQSHGDRVLMIGDGLNDAAVLTQSNVGMAVSNAMDVSKEQADIVLLNSCVENISWLVAYSRQIYRTIKLNMTWALLYNVAGVSFALAGLLRPVIAATAMAMSSLIIVLTSCLLPARKAGNDPVVRH